MVLYPQHCPLPVPVTSSVTHSNFRS